MEVIFFLSILTLIYIYIGYPACLLLLARIKGRQPVAPDGPLPSISLIIAAHNEEAVIRQKLDNCLALDYPGESIEIIVASDHSTDGTDDIVSEYAPMGVTLLRTTTRTGKTGAQNEAARLAGGYVLVFSDANSFWEDDALKKLVMPLLNKGVGYVCGQLKYTNTGDGSSSYSEGLYWRYELFLRRLESTLGSVTAGNGAIYAVRAADYHYFSNKQSHDFEFPRHVTLKGKRAIYVEDAIAYEKAGTTAGDEFKRKVRMLARVWGSIIKSPSALNPFNGNIVFTWEFFSHRLLRYLAPLPQAMAFAANLLLFSSGPLYQTFFMIQIIFYSLALLGAVFRFRPKVFYLPFYLCMFNFASMVGLAKSIIGPAPAYWNKALSTRS